MLTNERYEYLLNVPKVCVKDDVVIDFSQKKNRLELVSPDDDTANFYLEVTSNLRIWLKTSVHHWEEYGLLRVDFKGGTHNNPSNIVEGLPEWLMPYLGKFFTPEEHHIHICVEGYDPLKWAVPLKDYDFDIKELKEKGDLALLMNTFAEKINLTGNIEYTGLLL